jgi:tryptophanase
MLVQSIFEKNQYLIKIKANKWRHKTIEEITKTVNHSMKVQTSQIFWENN